MTTAVSFIALFALLVTLHEWGHFIVAKLSGVHVREFSIGIGTKLMAWEKNGTKYTIRLIPMGGYVRMASARDIQSMGEAGRQVFITETENGISEISQMEDVMARPVVMGEWLDDNSKLEVFDIETSEAETIDVSKDVWFTNDTEFREKIAQKDEWIESASVWKRVLIYLAGPVMNMVLAASLFIGSGLLIGSYVEEAYIGSMDESFPISETSVENGDLLLTIEGETVDKFADIGKHIGDKGGETLIMTFSRDGEEFTEHVPILDVEGAGKMGVRAETELGVGKAFKSGILMTVDITKATLQGVASLFTNFSFSSLGGPIYMAQATGEVTATASSSTELVYILMSWGAMLSINLAIVNMLPIPALDGGRIVIALIEGFRKKALSEDLEMKINLAGGLFILGLAFAVTISDIFSL